MNDLKPIALRDVFMEDRIAIYQWFKDSFTKSLVNNYKAVSKEQHYQWFESMRANPDYIIQIAYHNAIRIGLVSFKKVNGVWNLSYYLKPIYTKPDFHKSLIHSIQEFVNTRIKENVRFIVQHPNHRSEVFFQAHDFNTNSKSKSQLEFTVGAQ